MSKKHEPSEEEKELRRRMGFGADFAEKLKSMTENLSEEIKTRFQPAMEGLELLNRPLETKDVTINGKNIYISLLKDGKVVFNFASLEDGKAFFIETRDGFWKRLFKKLRK